LEHGNNSTNWIAAVALVPFGANIAKAKMRAVTEVTISCYNAVDK